MKFSSFLIFTAAGLAIAAPITPVTPSDLEKKLTVEPAEVVRRQSTLDPVVDAAHGKLPVPVKRGTPSVSSLSALTGAVPGGLPVGKRGIPSASSLSALTGAVPGGLPVGKRQDTVDEATQPLPDAGGLLGPVQGGLPKLPAKRQLEGLIPSTTSTDSDSNETAEEPKDPKEPKEPKEPSQITDGTTEIDDGTKKSTSSATDALSGLPIGKRQLDGVTGLLDPKPADPAEPTDETAPAEGEETEEEPVEGEDEEEEEPVEGEEEEPAAPAEKSALAGILKRQGLGDLTKGLLPESTPKDAEPKEDADAEAAPADEEDPDTTSKSQTSVMDDGTNGANSFDATPEEKAAAASAAPAKNATEPAEPAKKEKASGLAGLLGM
jgi:hypothetical protein